MNSGLAKRAVLCWLSIAVGCLFILLTVYGDDLLVSGESCSTGLSVVVHAPGGFTDRVELYSCSDLIAGDWRIATQDLRPLDGSPARWHTESSGTVFFRAGNMDADSDGDGLPDAREQFVSKTNPNEPDSDRDGMPDGWEVLQGLDPHDIRDAVGDADNDGFPNIIECKRSSEPFDLSNVPSGIVEIISDEGNFADQIATAIHDSDGCAIVRLGAGVHRVPAGVGVTFCDATVMVLGDGNAVIDCEASGRAFSIERSMLILSGVIIQGGSAPEDENLAGGGAVYAVDSSVLLRNSVLLNNRAIIGGSIHLRQSIAWLFNSTLTCNTAIEGSEIYTDSGSRVYARNSILHDENSGHSFQDDGSGEWDIAYSCTKAPWLGEGNITDNPGLIPYSWRLASPGSPVYAAGQKTTATPTDIDGELRGILVEMGADDWNDSDQDGLPDWWEILHFGSPATPIAGDTSADDGDGRFTYGEKFRMGLDPFAADTDGDSLPDYDEINSIRTDPLKNDTDMDGIPDGQDSSPLSAFEIEVNYPVTNSVVDSEFITLTGSVKYSGILNEVFVNQLQLDAEDIVAVSSNISAFNSPVTFFSNGKSFIDVTVRGTLISTGEEKYSTVRIPVEVGAFASKLIITTPVDHQIATSRSLRVQVLSDGQSIVSVNGETASRDGFMHYAWIVLDPGVNEIVAISVDPLGREITNTVSITCNVPEGTGVDPVADRDQDGVLDAEDPEPDNPSVNSSLRIDFPVNGEREVL